MCWPCVATTAGHTAHAVMTAATSGTIRISTPTTAASRRTCGCTSRVNSTRHCRSTRTSERQEPTSMPTTLTSPTVRHGYVYLCGDTFIRMTIRRRESGIVAISTSACGNASVSIGTGKTRINGYLLYSFSKSTFEIFRIRIKPPFTLPRIHIGLTIFSASG